MPSKSPKNIEQFRQVKMGLGEALRRLILVEMRFRQGVGGQEDLDERNLILDALNQVQLDIGFDCNTDGVPDTVEIFKQTVQTSCCRILPFDTSRRVDEAPLKTNPVKKVRKSSSRRKK